MLLTRKAPAGPRRDITHRPVAGWYLASILFWAFDFKPGDNDLLSTGAALIVQLSILLMYAALFIAIFRRAKSTETGLSPLKAFIAVCLLFCVESMAVGAWNGQDTWPMMSNAINILLFVSAAISTFLAFRASLGPGVLLGRLKSVCLAFMIIHLIVVSLNMRGLNLSTSRYQILSGASIPALGIFALGMFLRFGRKEILISLLNLMIILISVTRTQLVVFGGQVVAAFVSRPGTLVRPATFKKMLMAVLLAITVIGLDIGAGTGLSDRWIDRLTVGEKLGADPTVLTRRAETDFMLDEFTSSFSGFFFGHGLAALTSLRGPDAMLAGLLVGEENVTFHSIGYGHNNHASLLFIGGILAGMPLLVLTFMNGAKGVKLLRVVLEGGYDADMTYIAAWGALIVIGILISGCLSPTFGDRDICIWYGIGTGMLYWGAESVKKIATEKRALVKAKLASRFMGRSAG